MRWNAKQGGRKSDDQVMRRSGMQSEGRDAAQSGGRSEESVERVLAGLRSVEVPEGMEGRVLGRMAKVAERRLEERPGYCAGWNWLPVGGVLVAVLLVLAGVGGVRWRQRGATTSAARVVAPARVAAGSAGVDGRGVDGGMEAEGIPMAKSSVVKRRSEKERPEGRGSWTVEEAREAREMTEGFGEEARREEMVATEEMLAPSLVAPPLRLTREERLLQRAAQRGGADEMAALNEEERVKQGAASRAEFREFFGPSRSEVSE